MKGIKMKRIVCICMVLLLAVAKGHGAIKPTDVSKVKFEITRFSKRTGLLHWRITNNSEDGVYIYNFFLLGGAYNIERSPGRLIFDTSPIIRMASCPPDRVAPLVLTFVRSGGVIEGDFVDPEVKKAGGDEVSLKIAVGAEPNTVSEEMKHFFNSDCKQSPYNAIIDWATFLESNSVHVP
jgi:hypothetical protein